MRLLIALLVELTLKHSLIATRLGTDLFVRNQLPRLSPVAGDTGISTDTRIRNHAARVCHEDATRPTAMAIAERKLSFADITRGRLSVRVLIQFVVAWRFLRIVCVDALVIRPGYD